MTVSKYWGDEKHDDAVYSVYLKKVRYYPPQGYEGLPHFRKIDPDSHYLAQDCGTDQLQWETIKERIIKAGTLERLIESLISTDDKMDSRHFNVFFATYRAFGQPEDVANHLMQWFEKLEDNECSSRSSLSIQSSIRSICK
jgi:ral guanine nucleotide dissociation stimulator-like 1